MDFKKYIIVDINKYLIHLSEQFVGTELIIFLIKLAISNFMIVIL